MKILNEIKINIEDKAFGIMYWYEYDNSTVYFANIKVIESERNKGLGNQLLKYLESKSITLGFKYSCFWVFKNSYMHDWYKRNGYVDFQDYEDNYDYIWMKKELKEIRQ